MYCFCQWSTVPYWKPLPTTGLLHDNIDESSESESNALLFFNVERDNSSDEINSGHTITPRTREVKWPQLDKR